MTEGAKGTLLWEPSEEFKENAKMSGSQTSSSSAVGSLPTRAGRRSLFGGAWEICEPLPFGLREAGDSAMA